LACAFTTICEQPFSILYYCEIEDLSSIGICWMLPLSLSSVTTYQKTKYMINTDRNPFLVPIIPDDAQIPETQS
jgi:hypothetical protein